ncbi:unnamed protein product [Amoebophrya sp. A25]|nr:unnamed protein product [Amoebophrya sp. A25]|eukprot:GSA25T00000755001.1
MSEMITRIHFWLQTVLVGVLVRSELYREGAERRNDEKVLQEWLAVACGATSNSAGTLAYSHTSSGVGDRSSDFSARFPPPILAAEFPVKQVVVLMRHGARIPCTGGNAKGLDVRLGCWPDDDISFECPVERRREEFIRHFQKHHRGDHSSFPLSEDADGRQHHDGEEPDRSSVPHIYEGHVDGIEEQQSANLDQDRRSPGSTPTSLSQRTSSRTPMRQRRSFLAMRVLPTGNEWRGTCRLGQMTESGEQQCFGNGVRIREAYAGGSRGSNLLSKQLTVFSDDSSRVMRCGELATSAMMETHERESDSVISTKETMATQLQGDEEEDEVAWHLLGRPSGLTPGLCPAYGEALSEFWESEYVKELEAANPHLLGELRESMFSSGYALGKKLDSLKAVSKVMDCVHGHLCPTVVQELAATSSEDRNPRRPLNVSVLASTIRSGFATVKYQAFFESPRLAKLGVGPFLRTMLRNLQQPGRMTRQGSSTSSSSSSTPTANEVDDEASGGTSTADRTRTKEKVEAEELSSSGDHLPSLHVYFGHDGGPLGPFLGAVNASLPPAQRWPHFGSMMVIELSDERTDRARLIYNGELLDATAACPTGRCSRKSLLQKLEALIPSEEECYNKTINIAVAMNSMLHGTENENSRNSEINLQQHLQHRDNGHNVNYDEDYGRNPHPVQSSRSMLSTVVYQ